MRQMSTNKKAWSNVDSRSPERVWICGSAYLNECGFPGVRFAGKIYNPLQRQPDNATNRNRGFSAVAYKSMRRAASQKVCMTMFGHPFGAREMALPSTSCAVPLL